MYQCDYLSDLIGHFLCCRSIYGDTALGEANLQMIEIARKVRQAIISISEFEASSPHTHMPPLLHTHTHTHILLSPPTPSHPHTAWVICQVPGQWGRYSWSVIGREQKGEDPSLLPLVKTATIFIIHIRSTWSLLPKSMYSIVRLYYGITGMQFMTVCAQKHSKFCAGLLLWRQWCFLSHTRRL